MFDDVNFRHSLLAGSSWNMVLEVLVAVIDCLDSASLPGIPPGHGYWDWRGYGVAEDWVVDHSALEFFTGKLRFDLVVPVPGGVFLHAVRVSRTRAKTGLRSLCMTDRESRETAGTSWSLP